MALAYLVALMHRRAVLLLPMPLMVVRVFLVVILCRIPASCRCALGLIAVLRLISGVRQRCFRLVALIHQRAVLLLPMLSGVVKVVMVVIM